MLALVLLIRSGLALPERGNSGKGICLAFMNNNSQRKKEGVVVDMRQILEYVILLLDSMQAC